MSGKSGKRPLRSLSAHEKLDAIRRVHDGESKASVARDIGVPESTLRGWCKNEDKISYLSRQSSPETDESLESQIKKPKVEDVSPQPYNLSLKSNGGEYSGANIDQSKLTEGIKAPLKETPKSSTTLNERDRNRAELARLSVELGLNRPEMFLPGLNGPSSNLAELTTNIGLLAQWNALLLQQQQQKLQQLPKKVSTQTDAVPLAPAHTGLLTTVDQDKSKFPIKDKPSVHDSVWYWLKSQQSMLGISHTPCTMSNSITSISNLNGGTSSSTVSWSNITPTVSNISPDQNNWFKQMTYHHQPQVQDSKPILYQQLTKEVQQNQSFSPPHISPIPDQQNAENLSMHDERQKQTDKTHNNKDGKDEVLSQSEAVEHGEKFLKWMEACSDPSVTAMQIMQFRTLLNNIKSGADRKNGDLQNKTKGKRK